MIKHEVGKLSTPWRCREKRCTCTPRQALKESDPGNPSTRKGKAAGKTWHCRVGNVGSVPLGVQQLCLATLCLVGGCSFSPGAHSTSKELAMGW